MVNAIVLILLGLLVLFGSREFIQAMLRYSGIVFLAGGAVLLVIGINNFRRDRSGAMILVEAIAAVAVGIALLFFREASENIFLILAGIWVIIIGIVQLVILVNLKGKTGSSNLFLINGLLAIALGAGLLFNPSQWPVLLNIIGIAAIISGIILAYFSIALLTIKNPAEGAVNSQNP